MTQGRRDVDMPLPPIGREGGAPGAHRWKGLKMLEVRCDASGTTSRISGALFSSWRDSSW